MNDRELLEMAAKAAGYNVDWREWVRSRVVEFATIKHVKCAGLWLDGKEWNPLTDDGDALRLAVELGISFGVGAESKRMRVVWFIGCELHSMDMPANHHIALPPPSEVEWVRRAIVRAAAAIGEAL